jgi:PAS domain S-box-containing protein
VNPHGPGWESMFWLLFEKSSNPVALLEEIRRFVDVNDAALAVLGQTRGAVIGRFSTDLMKAGERVEATRRWRVLAEPGEGSGRRTFVRPDGTEVEVRFAARIADIGERRLAVFVVEGTAPPTAPAADVTVANVTPREPEVIRLIAGGAATRDIAAELSISRETVRTHVRNAMRKLGVRTRAQLVAISLALDADPPAP